MSERSDGMHDADALVIHRRHLNIQPADPGPMPAN
jgi:hypothetical protein